MADTKSKSSKRRPYENAEYYEMVRLYILSGGCATGAQRLYAEPKHLEMLRKRGVVDPKPALSKTITRAHANLFQYGQFTTPACLRGAGGKKIPPEIDKQIIKYFKKNPRHSTGIAANRFHVSRTHVSQVLRDAGMKPYQIAPKKYYVASADDDKRVSLCRWILDNSTTNILWMDESKFSNMNIHHNRTHYYSKENPNIIEEKPVTISITVWAAVLNDVILGPIFFEENLTGELYLDLLKNKLPNLLEELPLTYIKDLFYQHNGNPVHCHKIVRKYMNKKYGERWIGKDGPIPWPPKTEDLSPMSVYVWPQIRKYVYTQEFKTVKELQQKITNAFEKLKNDRGKLEQARIKIQKNVKLTVQNADEMKGNYSDEEMNDD